MKILFIKIFVLIYREVEFAFQIITFPIKELIKMIVKRQHYQSVRKIANNKHQALSLGCFYQKI